MRILAVAALVFCSCFITSAEWIGSPFLLCEDVAPGDSPSDQWDATAASDGTSWLVIWADNWTAEIYGMRLNNGGHLLDEIAFPVVPRTMWQYVNARRRPSIAWTGDRYLVVWEDYASTYNAYGCHVSAEGVVEEATPFSVETSSSSTRYPVMAWGRTNGIVAWSGYYSGYKLYAQMLDGDGHPVGSVTQLVTGLSGYVAPSVVFKDFSSGTNFFLITFSLSGDIRGMRVSDGGAIADATPLSICATPGWQSSPSVAAGTGPLSAEGWWAAWVDDRTGSDDIYGGFVDQAGNVSHSSTGTCLITAADTQDDPALAWNGTNYLLSWRDWNVPLTVRASVMDSSGGIADAAGTEITTNDTYGPVLGRSCGGTMLSLHGFDAVWGHPITTAGTTVNVVTERLVSIRGEYENDPHASFDGENYWVGWCGAPDAQHREGDILARRMATNGVFLDSSPFGICTNSDDQNLLVMASSTGHTLFVWTDERNGRDQVWGQLATKAGALQDTNFMIAANALYAYFPDVASDGTNFLVVWDDANVDRIKGKVIGADGSMGGEIDPGSLYVTDPSVAYGDSCYLLVWCDSDNDWDYQYVRARRYQSDGTPMDGAYSNLYYTANGDCYEVRAAYSPTADRFLIVWQDTDVDQILGVLYDASTGAADGSTIQINTSTYSSYPRVIWDGTTWVVLCSDTRNNHAGLYLTRVNTSGTVLDPTPYPAIYGAGVGEMVSEGAAGDALLVTTHRVYGYRDRTYNNTRAMGLFWRSGTPGAGTNLVQCGFRRGDGKITLEALHDMPGPTSYVAQACSSLTLEDWDSLTNACILDSGVCKQVTAQDTNSSAAARFFRVRGN